MLSTTKKRSASTLTEEEISSEDERSAMEAFSSVSFTNDLQVINLKLIEADISAMLKLYDPPIKTIEMYLAKMQQLIEEASSNYMKLKWNARLNSLEKVLKSVNEDNKLGKELSALQNYIQILFNNDLSREEIKESIDKLSSKVKKIVASGVKNKWTLVADSLLKDYNKLEPFQFNVVADNDGFRDQSLSNELSVPTFPTPNVLKSVSIRLKLFFNLFLIFSIYTFLVF